MTLLTGPPATSRRGWFSFAIVSVAIYASLLDTFIVNLAFSAIQKDFPGSGLADLSWIFTAYAIVFAALLVPSGRISDAIGRKRMFLLGLGLFVAASAACAIAISPAMLIAARILQAAGAALFTPAALAVVLPEFPPQRRAAVFGAWAAVGGAGAASGPLLGAVLVQFDWRWIFLVNLPLGMASLILGSLRLRESRDRREWQLPDLWGTAGLIVGVTALTLTIDKFGQWSLPTTLITAAIAAAILLAVVGRSLRHRSPALEIGLLRRRTFLFAVSSALLFSVSFAAGILAGAQFLPLHWHQSILATGLQLSPGPIMAACVAIPSSRLLGPRLGPHRVGAIGGLLMAAGAVWLTGRIGPTPAYVSELLPAQLLTGMGVGMTIPSFVSVALSVVDPARISTAVGISSMFQQMGSAFGAAAFVSIVGNPAAAEPIAAINAFHRGWLFVAGMAILSAVVLLSSGFTPYERRSATHPAKDGGSKAATAGSSPV
ncbi:MFS transporter [Fodinicola feengrottensis]|uniref:MFS transporter n=1 Tax=Fodinicola feengrottensis TaxID=435914 RepID=A0ABP4UV82_9ACTN